MIRRVVLLFAVVFALGAIGGCSTIGYYYQAARGHMALTFAARPIDAVIADPLTTPDLRARLESARAMREFASRELALPDNATYRRYADLKRPFVVWNVFGAAEFSIRAREWCFPVAGCVGYKGWFDEGDANRFAESVRQEGFDVFVGGVPAYSTLGWFDDPMLSTFIRYPRAELARLVFHELAHQVAYAGGDSTFNESFATSVELEGVRRWLGQTGSEAERAEFEAMQGRKRDFVALVERTRARLDRLYASGLPVEAMRAAKQGAFDDMRREYGELKAAWGGFAGYDRWFAQPLGNAHLASIATYTQRLPAFEALLAREKGALPQLYAQAQRLARLPQRDRDRELDALMPREP